MKKIIKWMVAPMVCCGACVALPVEAQSQEAQASVSEVPLSLEQCRERAVAHNKELQAARKSTERYERNVKAYRANYFPNIKLVANNFYSNSDGSLGIKGGYLPLFNLDAASGSLVPDVVVNPATGQPVMGSDGNPVFKQYAYMPDQSIDYKINNVIQAGITLEQPIYMGGKVTAAYKMSKLGARMAEVNESLTQSEVLVNVDNAYMLAVKAQEMGKVAIKYNEMLQTLKQNVESAYKHGMGSYNDVLKVSVKFNESELKLRQAENAQRLASMNLSHAIGAPLSQQLRVDAETPQSITGLRDTLANVANRPEYALLTMKSELAAQQVNLDRSDFLPQVTLAGTYSYINGLKVNGEKFFDSPSAGVLLNVSIPLTHFGEGINKVKAARLEHERTELQKADLVEQMNLELMQAANNLDETLLEVDLNEKALQQAEDNMKNSKRQYEVGLESLVNYMEAQTLWQQAYANLIDAKCRLIVCDTKYRKAAGLLK